VSPIDKVLAALCELGCSPKQNCSGWSARCPAHKDQNPSLSVSQGDDGRVLLHCHAGCGHREVTAALGLRERDLFGPQEGDRPPAAAHIAAKPASFTTLEETLAAKRPSCRPSTVWRYQDASGRDVGAIARWEVGEGKKILPFSRRDDGWVAKAMPTPRPLYRLNELIAARGGGRVYITEGEKTADAVRSAGLVATTSAGGSNAARKSDWSPLRGKEAVVLIDHDAAGERFGAEVTGCAHRAGAKSVRIVRLAEIWPEMPQGGDFVDIVGAGGLWSGLCQEAVRAQLDALVVRVAVEVPDFEEAPSTVQPFPVDALPNPLGDFVTLTATALGCDPAMVAVPVLGVLAGCVGCTRVVVPKAGWAEPLVLWCMVIAPSGSLKSPAIDAALHPLMEMQRLRLQEYGVALEDYREAKVEYERRIQEWRNTKSLEPPCEPELPVLTRYLASDFTVEALVALLAQNPRGLLVATDELARLVRGLDRYRGGRGGDLQALLEMHRAGPVVVDRKGGDPPQLIVSRAAVSIVGGIQPGVARRIFQGENEESGFIARFLVCAPPVLRKSWTEATCPRPLVQAYEELCGRLLQLEFGRDTNGDAPVELQLSPGAREHFAAFYNSIAARQAEASSDAERSALAKLEGAAARFAGLFHLAALADEGRHTSAEPVCDAAMRAGVRVAEWFENEAIRFCERRVENETERNQRELVEWIAQGGADRSPGAVTVRQLTKGLRRFRGRQAEAAAALDALVSTGLADWDTRGGKPGRPARRVILRGTVTVPETTPGRVVGAGSGDGDSPGRQEAAA